MLNLRFLLFAILPLGVIAAENKALPEWQRVISELDKKSIRFARDFFSKYLEGKVAIEDVKNLEPKKRAAIAAVALTEFLKKDFLKRHPKYQPGTVYELVTECSKEEFDKDTTLILRKASGTDEKTLLKSVSSENLAHFKTPALHIPLFIVAILPILISELPLHTAKLFLLPLLLLLATTIPQNVELLTPARYGKEPTLKISRSEADEKFEMKMHKTARIAEIDPDMLVIPRDHQRGPRASSPLVPPVNLFFRDRKIVVSSFNQKVQLVFSKKELASMLRHEFRHTRQILLVFANPVFLSLFVLVPTLAILRRIKNRFSGFPYLWVFLFYLTLSLGFVLPTLLIRLAEHDADKSAIKFMSKKFGEKEGRQTYAAALEKVYLLGRANSPVMILPYISKKKLQRGDIMHGGALKRIRKLAEGK